MRRRRRGSASHHGKDGPGADAAPETGGGPPRAKADGAKAGGAEAGGRRRPPLLPLALVLGLIGAGLGYMVATRIVFPAAEQPTDLVEVPDLAGMTQGALNARIQAADLVLADLDSVHHPRVPAGEVLGQSPLPGQMSLPGDSVWVMVSMGPMERPIPDVMRIRADRALGVLEASGFMVDVDTVDAMTPRGSVVAVIPEAGELASVPSEVQLVISRGPPMVLVPLLVGLNQVQAEAALDSAGLALGTVLERFRFGLDEGTVIQQEPAAGSELEQGGAVDLVVGRRGGERGARRFP